MGVKTLRDLLIYQLGMTRTRERRGDLMLSDIANRLQNQDIKQALHEEEERRLEHAANIDACLKALGASPLEENAPVIEGLRQRFFSFSGTEPSPEALDLFALGTALRHTYLVIASYREVVLLAELAGEGACQERLRQNLHHKEQYATRLEQRSRELGQQLLVTA